MQYSKAGLRAEGTLHLTAHHLIFKYVGGGGEQEVWVCVPLRLTLSSMMECFGTDTLPDDHYCDTASLIPIWPISPGIRITNFRILHVCFYEGEGCDGRV